MSYINKIVLSNSKYWMEGIVALRQIIENNLLRASFIRRYDRTL
jgi:hypothetical protein